MKTKLTFLTKAFNRHPSILFLTNGLGLVQSLIWLFKQITKITNENNFKMQDFPLDLKDLIIFIMSLFFYLFYKSFLNLRSEIVKVKNEAIDDTNYISKELTDIINDSHSFLDTKIRYVHFCTENSHLTEEHFIRELNKQGFSKEDLEQIGVNEEFLKKHSSKLLPKRVMDKYKDFKEELNDYKRDKLNQNEHNSNN